MNESPTICIHEDCLRAAVDLSGLCAECLKFEQLTLAKVSCCPECNNDSEDYL